MGEPYAVFEGDVGEIDRVISAPHGINIYAFEKAAGNKKIAQHNIKRVICDHLCQTRNCNHSMILFLFTPL